MTLPELDKLLRKSIPELESDLLISEKTLLFFALEIPSPRKNLHCRVSPMKTDFRVVEGDFILNQRGITGNRTGNLCLRLTLPAWIQHFQENPAFTFTQPMKLYNIPTFWELECFFDFTGEGDKLTSLDVRFGSKLLCTPTAQRRKLGSALASHLTHHPDFANLCYAYTFCNAPVEPIQDFIQERLL